VFNPTVPPGGVGIPPTATVESIMLSGFRQWQGAANLRIAYAGQSPAVVDVVCLFQGTCQPDGVNSLGWVLGLQTGELARPVWFHDGGGDALDCDIGLNANLATINASWATGAAVGGGQYDLVTAVLHEEGHLLGLGHSWAPQPDCARCAAFPATPSA